jgi:hypothetical protein
MPIKPIKFPTHRVPFVQWLPQYTYQFNVENTPGGTLTTQSPPQSLLAFISFNSAGGGPQAPIADINCVSIFQQTGPQTSKPYIIPSPSIQMQTSPNPYWQRGDLSWNLNNQSAQPIFNLTFNLTDAKGAVLCTGKLLSIPATPAKAGLPGYLEVDNPSNPTISPPLWFASGTWLPSTIRGVITEWIDVPYFP